MSIRSLSITINVNKKEEKDKKVSHKGPTITGRQVGRSCSSRQHLCSVVSGDTTVTEER